MGLERRSDSGEPWKFCNLLVIPQKKLSRVLELLREVLFFPRQSGGFIKLSNGVITLLSGLSK